MLKPAHLGVLASVGRTPVRVVRPRMAVVSTGDELVEPDRTPGPGQIRNSNAIMLRALAIEEGAAAESLPTAPDEPGELRRILERGLDFDVLIVTGGVSAGQRDLVPAALAELGRPSCLSQGPAQAGQAALVRDRPDAGRPARHPGLRPAGQSGQQPGRLSAVRQTGPGGPGRPAGPGSRDAPGTPDVRLPASRRSAHLPPGAAGRGLGRWSIRAVADRDRDAQLARVGRSPDRRRRPTVSPPSPRGIAITAQVKLSDSCRRGDSTTANRPRRTNNGPRTTNHEPRTKPHDFGCRTGSENPCRRGGGARGSMAAPPPRRGSRLWSAPLDRVPADGMGTPGLGRPRAPFLAGDRQADAR